MDDLELIVNVVIILLLLPTLIYAFKLNKNLSALRQNQSSLATLIKSLNEATKKAESSIPKLKSFTEHSSSDLKGVIDSAKNLKDDLMFINQRADGLADRLEGIIHEARPAEEKQKSKEKEVAQSQEKKEQTIDDARSLAEMELLKALRSIK